MTLESKKKLDDKKKHTKVPKKIVVIEDSEVGLFLVQKTLESIGYEAYKTYLSSTQAWQDIAESITDSNPFDLIITDLNMPELHGMDLLLSLKEDPLGEKIKTVVISAEMDTQTASLLKDIGVNGYFTKPVEEYHLRKTLDALFSNTIPEDRYAFNLLKEEKSSSSNSK